MKDNVICGIDLGTSNSVVCVVEAGMPAVLVNESGSRITPSIVGFTDKGERLVGQRARNQQVTNPKNTVYSIKRFMGRRHSEVGNEEKIVPYQVTGGAEELVKVHVNGKDYSPPEVSAMILADLKKTAERYLGHEVTRAVITVPAYFNDAQRQATKEAGQIAGLTVERIINEPTAAALAYGLDKKKEGKVAIFDLGGGTFDISILDIGDGVFEVLSTNGDTHLGGDDFDQVLVKFIAEEFRKKEGIDLMKDSMALQRVKEAAERAKCELSGSMETSINLPYITADASGPKHLQLTLTRARFEQLIGDLVEKCRGPVLQAIKDASVNVSDIKEVVLVGGSTRMPCVRQLVKDLFGQEPNSSVNPDEVVAVGAAIQGSILTGDRSDIVLLDVTPLSLGLETLGGVMTVMIPRNTTIPTTKKETFSTATDNQPVVDIHILQGERKMAADNRTLGRFQLADIPPARRGTPKIEVSLDIDANGILNVSAKDLGTGKEQKIEIKASSGLSKEEVEKMVQDAAKYAVEDEQKKKLSDTKNSADQMAYASESVLKEHGEKIDPALRAEVESAVNRVRDVQKGDDVGAIESAVKDLETVSQKVGAAIYEKVAAEQAAKSAETVDKGQTNTTEPTDAGSDVIDAEYEVKN